jgi:GT2 family glycosyltransferase
MKPSVCVTIVTYNTRQYIESCLESIFAQNYSSLEVVGCGQRFHGWHARDLGAI